MGIKQTAFEGLLIFEPRIFEDERGYFFESFNKKLWEKTGINLDFVQDNESKSKYGSIRGLHYQISPTPQAKLIRVTKGKVLDVVVDLRKDQETYGQKFSIVLSQKNKKQLYIPRGFAHGFATLSKSSVFNYKCDNYFDQNSEQGIDPLDEYLAINWGIPKERMIISEKDKNAKKWQDHTKYVP